MDILEISFVKWQEFLIESIFWRLNSIEHRSFLLDQTCFFVKTFFSLWNARKIGDKNSLF